MVDIIYSRRRIRFPKRKQGKFSQIKLLIFIVMVILVGAVVSFVMSSYPIFVASCKTAAGSKANHIVSEEVEKMMAHYAYQDLVNLEKDEQGNVIFMQINTILMNQLVSQIVKNIQTRIDNSPTTMVYINYGSVSGVTILKNFGPKFEIELETAGKIETQINSKVENVGVNQTLHKIYLSLNTNIGILTPIGSFGKDVASEVLLTEAIIFGKVPETYYNLEGMGQSDVLNVLE